MSDQDLTQDELAALPVGSVVIQPGGRAFQRYEPRVIGVHQYHTWMCADGGFVRDDSYPHMLTGSRLVYRPDRPNGTDQCPNCEEQP